MIVICNGLYKSGSTYVFSALRIALNPGGPPDGIQCGKINKLNPVLSKANLDRAEQERQPIVIKTHCYDQAVLEDLACRESVLMILTDRNTKDIIKSHYHHFSSEKKKIPLALYLLSVGLVKMIEVELYREALQEISRRNSKKAKFVELSYFDLFHRREITVDKLAKHHSLKKHGDAIHDSFNTAFVKSGKDIVKITGMENREWFINREDITYSKSEELSLRAAHLLALTLVKVRLVNILLRFVFSSVRQQRISYFNLRKS